MFAAGARPLDHVSSPKPKAAKLAAVAVPDPFEDPEAKAAVEVVRQHILKRLDQAQGTVQAVVVPVKHTLTIVPKS